MKHGTARRLLCVVVALASVLLLWLAVAGEDSQTTAVLRVLEAAPPEKPAAEASWSILFYSNADGDVVNVSDEFAELMQSSEAAHVLMLEDPRDVGATLWHISGSPGSPVLSCLESWGEVDMADGDTLLRFVDFAKTWYPSDRMIVMLYSHGRGWRGACYDNVPAPEGVDAEWSWLTPQEMQEVFSSVGGIDALLFTAPCITAAAELVYELREPVDLVIAAEPVSSFSMWRGGLRLLNQLLTDQPEIALGDLATVVLDEIQLTYDREEVIREYEVPARNADMVPHVGLTAVLCDERLDGLAHAIDAFSHALLEAVEDSFSSIEWRRNHSQDFGNYEVVDIYDFAEQCSHISELETEATALMASVDDVVFKLVTDSAEFPGAHGLSLYFPMTAPGSAGLFEAFHRQSGFGAHGKDYRTQGLDLMRETYWDEFLLSFYARKLQD